MLYCLIYRHCCWFQFIFSPFGREWRGRSSSIFIQVEVFFLNFNFHQIIPVCSTGMIVERTTFKESENLKFAFIFIHCSFDLFDFTVLIYKWKKFIRNSHGWCRSFSLTNSIFQLCRILYRFKHPSVDLRLNKSQKQTKLSSKKKGEATRQKRKKMATASSNSKLLKGISE